MTEDHVFPEDTGTGATGGDNADAANFGALAQHDFLSDYKASGLSIQNIDYTNLTFDVTAGKAFIKDSSATAAQSGKVRDQGVVYEVESAPRTAVGLTDTAINEIYIDIDLTVDDSVSVSVITDGTTPSAPFLKIAEIDTNTDTLDESYANSFDTDGRDVKDGVTTIYDSSANEIPETTLATINNSTLSNSSVTINANNGISGGGSVSLGNSIGINVSASDFAGSGLTTDVNGNLDLSTDLTTKADLTQSGGVLVSSQLPDLAITNIDVVADQTARLALDAEEGDVAIQTDVSQTFILATNDPTVDSNWKQVQLDVLGAIDGQTITPAQTGTSTNPTTVVASSVTEGGNNVVTSPNADRDIFVIASGASDPSAADADDIILEKS